MILCNLQSWFLVHSSTFELVVKDLEEHTEVKVFNIDLRVLGTEEGTFNFWDLEVTDLAKYYLKYYLK